MRPDDVLRAMVVGALAPELVASLREAFVSVEVVPEGSWLALLRTWRIPPDRLTDRDRVER